MQFSLDHEIGTYAIRSVSPGHIQINHTVYTHSVIVSAQTLIEPWKVTGLSSLTREDLTIIDQLNPSVVLLGTGTHLQFPNPALLAHFTQRHIGIEVMNTAAACRTFTALASEGRQVVAALIIEATLASRV